MTALLILLACTGFAVLGHRRRSSNRSRGAAPRRSRVMFVVVLVLGLQAGIGAPAAYAADCSAPNPERPGSGLVGALDPPQRQGLEDSPYQKYGYAGSVWHVYPEDCVAGSGGGGVSDAMSLPDPGTSIDNWLGNQAFNVAKNIVGATNALHYTVMEGGLLSPLYNAVKSGAEKVYNNIYAQLFGVAALLLALALFRNIWRGDLATVGKRGLFALGAVWLAASSLALLRYYDDIDNAIVQTTTNIQSGFVDQSEDKVTRDVLPTQLHNEVVYDNWLRGEFGSPDAPQASEYGGKLLDAQSFTWSEIRKGDDAKQSVVDDKKKSYKKTAKQLGPATGYFTGEDGSRTGSGALALGQSIVYSLFQLFAKAAVLLAQVLIRLFTLTAPLLGLVAIVHHDLLRRVGRVMGGVAFNLLVLSVLAGVHVVLLQAIFDAGDSLSMLTKMVVAGLITVLLFVVGKPTKRLWQMVETSVGAMGSGASAQGNSLFSRFRNRSGESSAQDEFWRNRREEENEGADSSGRTGRARPEATVQASAQRLDRQQRPGSHPASAWPGGTYGTPEVAGGSAGALPPAGSAAAAAAFPAHGRASGAATPQRGAEQGQPGASRRVDTAPVAGTRWDHGDEPEPVVVPSRVTSHGTPRAVPQQRSAGQRAGTQAQSAAQGSATGPRPAESEMVAGKPVHVLYRPSQGLEVRQHTRDTDGAVR